MPCPVGADQRVRPLRGARRDACHTGNSCGASRQACHAGGHAGRGTQPRAVREFQAPTAAKTGAVARRTARSTSTRRRLKWSKPPGLPCRRSRRQSHTHATRTGFPNAIQPERLRTPPQPAAPRRCRPACPPPLFLSPCPPWSVFLRVLRVLCGLLFCVSSVSSVVCFSPCPPCSPWFAFLRALRVVSDVGQAF